MASITITEARKHLTKVSRRVSFRGERIIVTRRGQSLFAIVPAEDVELLEHMEDEADLRAIRRAQKEKGPNIPWEKVKKNLGL